MQKNPFNPYKSLENKIEKYEKVLIAIASFEEGEISSRMDEPGSAEIARKALGKRLCKKLLKEAK